MKYSLSVYLYKLSNNSVIVSINRETSEAYLKQINQYQNNKISFYNVEKNYSHVKNNDCLKSIVNYFNSKNVDMIIFNENENIKSISDFELLVLKENLNLKLNGFEYEEALKFLRKNNLLEAFLENKLTVNKVYYYSEYSRSFGERVNIKNQKETISDISKIQNYIKNSLLYDEHESQSVYHCSKKCMVISFESQNQQIYLEDNKEWLQDLFNKNKDKTNGFPYAQGKVFENNFIELMELAH